MDVAAESIVKNLQTFVAFVRNRVGDAHLAEDVVQECLVKALAAERKPDDEAESIAWFYRILRRAIIDLYRRKDARARALDRFEAELPESPDAEDSRVLCQCLMRLLPAVPSQYHDALRKVDLEGRDLSEVAAELGVSRNNLAVRLHRARRHLRDALSKNCRACSHHGCLDCTCEAEGESGHH